MPKIPTYNSSSPKYSYWEIKTYFELFDFIVIGSGIVGLSTAIELKLKKPKSNILILEKGILPNGASSKNAGFACFGSVSELLDDIKTTDEEVVWNTVKMRFDGLKLLRKRLGDKSLCYNSYGGFEWFDNAIAFEKCLHNIDFLNKKFEALLGLKNVYTKSNNYYGKSILGCIKNNYEGQLDTAAMNYNLSGMASSLGIKTLHAIDVIKLEDVNKNAVVITPIGDFKAKKVIVATNGFASQLLKIKHVKPARAQVLITKPISNLKLKGSFHFNKGYNYFRNIDNRILLGGGRNLDIKAETTTNFELNWKIQNYLTTFLNEVVAPNQKVEIEHRWCGIMGVGKEKKPIIEFVTPNILAAVRMGGMGVAIGSMVGKIAVNKILKS